MTQQPDVSQFEGLVEVAKRAFVTDPQYAVDMLQAVSKLKTDLESED